jgi:hypothetical protein
MPFSNKSNRANSIKIKKNDFNKTHQEIKFSQKNPQEDKSE